MKCGRVVVGTEVGIVGAREAAGAVESRGLVGIEAVVAVAAVRIMCEAVSWPYDFRNKSHRCCLELDNTGISFAVIEEEAGML